MRRFGGSMPVSRGAVAQRFDDRAEIRLRSEPAHRIHRAVDGIHAGVHRREHAGGGDAARVVRVEMHRQPDLFLQRLDQRVRGARLAQSRHVLDAEDVRAGRLQLATHLRGSTRACTWSRSGECRLPV